MVLALAQIILIAIAPALGYDAWVVWKSFLIDAAIGLICSYVVVAFSVFVLFLIERKRMPKISFGIKLCSTLLMPIFMVIAIPLDLLSFFVKNLSWKAIPHMDTTNFDKIHQHVKKHKKKEVEPRTEQEKVVPCTEQGESYEQI
jgi:hypothetical protein